jgi:uncharacterized protein YcaQ
MRVLTWDAVRARRLVRNSLTAPVPPDEFGAMVGAVCGIQAQIMVAAELAISARIAAATQANVRAELWERRQLVKTYGPRETLHLLPADELPLWMSAMRARAARRESRWYEGAGLDAGQGDALLAAIGDALDSACLTREELTDAVTARVGAWAREEMLSAWGGLLRPAAFTGRLCFGPNRGSKVTFVRADQWIGHWRDHDPEAALTAMCRRYVATYGPVTHQDFARWFALQPDQARRVLASLGDELEAVTVDGQRAWMLADDVDVEYPEVPGVVRLLPQYDCYLLGSGQRERIVPAAARARIRSYGRGRYEGAVGVPVLLIDGIVAGIWERRTRGKRIEIRVEPVVELTAAQHRQLADEADRMGAFFGTEATLALGALDG